MRVVIALKFSWMRDRRSVDSAARLRRPSSVPCYQGALLENAVIAVAIGRRTPLLPRAAWLRAPALAASCRRPCAWRGLSSQPPFRPQRCCGADRATRQDRYKARIATSHVSQQAHGGLRPALASRSLPTANLRDELRERLRPHGECAGFIPQRRNSSAKRGQPMRREFVSSCHRAAMHPLRAYCVSAVARGTIRQRRARCVSW